MKLNNPLFDSPDEMIAVSEDIKVARTLKTCNSSVQKYNN